MNPVEHGSWRGETRASALTLLLVVEIFIDPRFGHGSGQYPILWKENFLPSLERNRRLVEESRGIFKFRVAPLRFRLKSLIIGHREDRPLAVAETPLYGSSVTISFSFADGKTRPRKNVSGFPSLLSRPVVITLQPSNRYFRNHQFARVSGILETMMRFHVQYFYARSRGRRDIDF